MTVRLIVANGCSFTWGDELADRADAWPTILGRQLGVEVVNLGACGGSNRRIVRTTVETLPSLVNARQLRPDEVLFLAMWASIERYEFFDKVPDPIGRSDWLAGDEHWRRVLPWAATRRDRIARTYYKDIHDDEGAVITFLVDWVLLQSLLVHHGYRYGFLAARPLFVNLPDPPKHLVELINQRRVLGGLLGLNEKAMSVVVDHDRHPYGPRRHPLASAHRDFALTTVLPWVNRLMRYIQ